MAAPSIIATFCAKQHSCPSDRHTEGLAASLTVRENTTFAALDRFAAYGLLSRKREVEQVATTFKSLAVKTASLEAPILSLCRRQSTKGRNGSRLAVGTQT